MIKMVFMLKKRADMTREQFITRYEGGHRLLGERHVPNAVRYVRRYLEPVPGPFTGAANDYDVLTELWFNSLADYESAMAFLAVPAILDEIVADEEQLFDRSRSRVYLVEEHESKPGALAGAVD